MRVLGLSGHVHSYIKGRFHRVDGLCQWWSLSLRASLNLFTWGDDVGCRLSGKRNAHMVLIAKQKHRRLRLGEKGMANGVSRIAVCQLDSHPALAIGDIDYLGEPLPHLPRERTLAGLSRHSIDVAELQGRCAQQYKAWHAQRIGHVLQWLSRLNPIPELVVLPEGALPIELLPPVREFAIEWGVTVFAGTHTLRLTHQAAMQYKNLGIKHSVLKSWGERQQSCTAVLPIFTPNCSYFHLKALPSVFEQTDVRQSDGGSAVIHAIRATIGGSTISVAPMVCAEALRRHRLPREYSLLVICAYNASVEPFESIVSQHVTNRIPVIVANEGRFGGSSVCAPITGLPIGDGTTLLDQQLRRTGLDPAHYSQDQRSRIVGGLAGHPGAIVLASEYIEESGIEQVLSDIEGRKGVHERIVKRILTRLHLSDEQATVLSILSLARAPVPAWVVNEAISFNGIAVLQDLRKLALLERHANDHVAVTGLIRGYAELPCTTPEEARTFHEAAAKAFAKLSGRAETADQLRLAVESRFHAYAAEQPGLAPDLRGIADGALGAAQELLRQQHYERARPIVDELLSSHRKPEILELAANVYANLGMCEEGLALAKEAVSAQSERVWILTEVGRLALHVHQVEVAEDAIRIAKATGVDNPFLAVLEGRVCLRKDRVEDAIKAFQRGTAISEWDGWPHFYLGRTLAKTGAIDEALEVLERGEAIENKRRHPRRRALTAIRTQIAYGHLYQDNVEAAKHWLGILAESNANDPEVARAAAYVRLRSSGPIVTEELLSGLDPRKARNRHERAQTHLFRALIFLNTGHREKASEELSRASKEDPRNVFVLLRWAWTLIDIARDASAEGEHEAARFCAEQAQTVSTKALEFNKTNEEALEILELLSDEFNVD